MSMYFGFSVGFDIEESRGEVGELSWDVVIFQCSNSLQISVYFDGYGVYDVLCVWGVCGWIWNVLGDRSIPLGVKYSLLLQNRIQIMW